MNGLSFDRFSKKIHIKAPIEKVYRCWGTTDGISSWFLRHAEYSDPDGKVRAGEDPIQKGDRYTWEWHNWDGQECGEVLEANGHDRFEITFEQCLVTVHLQPTETTTLLCLTQSQIPTDDESKLNLHHGCSNGWTFWLTNLKAFLEHGILLNETEKDLRNVPLASFEFVNM